MMRRLILIAIALGACKRETPAAPPDAALAAHTATTSLTATTARDQYALVREIVGARSGETEASFGRTTRSWIGKRYTWESALLVPLCATPAHCNVVPFDYAKVSEPILQGWLPSLEMTPDEHAKMLASCKALPSCVVKFEGTMSTLELSPGLPTAVGFKEVKILDVRAARPDERWGQRHPAKDNKKAPEP